VDKRNPKVLITVVIACVVLVAVVITLVLTLGHKNSSSLTSAQQDLAKQQIQNSWETFFAANTSLQNRENVLENGSKFTVPIHQEFDSLDSQAPSATVSSITLTSPTTANVVYTIKLNNQPVLTNQKGQAVYITSTWEVSDATLCGLLNLGGVKPTACQNI